MQIVRIISTCNFVIDKQSLPLVTTITSITLHLSCSREEDCIAIDFVLVEIFQVVYRAKFFDRGFFLRRDPQLAVTPQPIHSFPSAPNGSNKTLGIVRKDVGRGEGKGPQSLRAHDERCARHVECAPSAVLCRFQ